tara:strand:- start:271 stop:696 length:426 start_codon:yes stop_codon:yes gene_type:complete
MTQEEKELGGNEINKDGYQYVPDGSPGLEELLVERDKPNNSDPIHELLNTSEDSKSWLPKAIFSKKERKNITRIIHMERFVLNFEANGSELAWLDGALSIAEGGRGRKDAVEILSGPSGRGQEYIRSRSNKRSRFAQENAS